MSTQSSSGSQSTTYYPDRSRANPHRRPLSKREVTRRPFTFIRNWETGESPVAAVLAQSQSSDLSVTASSQSQEDSVFVSPTPRVSSGHKVTQSPIPVVIQSPVAQVIPETQPTPVVDRLSSIVEDTEALEEDDDDMGEDGGIEAGVEENMDDAEMDEEEVGDEVGDEVEEADVVEHEEATDFVQVEITPDDESEHLNDEDEPMIWPSPRPQVKVTSPRKRVSVGQVSSPAPNIKSRRSVAPQTPADQSLGLTLRTPGSLLKSGVVSRIRNKHASTVPPKVSHPKVLSRKKKTDTDQDYEDTRLFLWQGDRRRLPGNIMDLDIILNELENECYTFKERSNQKSVRNAIVQFYRTVQKDVTQTIDLAEEVKSMKSLLGKSSAGVRRNRKELLAAQKESLSLKNEYNKLKAEHDPKDNRQKEMEEISNWMQEFQKLQKKYRDSEPTEETNLDYGHEDNAEALLMETKLNLESAHKLRTINDKLEEWLND